jgi:hypothetical protein
MGFVVSEVNFESERTAAARTTATTLLLSEPM